jgi:hypothetical protein
MGFGFSVAIKRNRVMKHSELEGNIGKRVKINGDGDLGMIHEMKKFIYDDANEHELYLDKISSGGLAVIRYKNQLISVRAKNLDLYESPS